MLPTEPQFIYLILILPTLFGLTLVGDGIYKLIHEENIGWMSIILGIGFIGLVIFAFFFFSTYLAPRG